MQRRKFHASTRVECPECSSKALAPLVDHAKPDGLDRQQGYCYVCSKVIGAKGARYISSSDREALLQKWYDVSTRDGLRLRNGLATYLQQTFAGTPYAESLPSHLLQWSVGTDDAGSCVFWYRDETQALRTAKVVPYDSSTGKRRKGVDSPIRWTNKDGKMQYVDNLYGLVTGTREDGSLRIESFSTEKGYSTCLYGAHFVGSTSPDTPVLLVESEKSAVVASLFLYPNMLVVATGGANAITKEKASVLAGRDVYVLLDADDTGRRSTESVVETLASVGARPVCEVDGVPLVDYLLPNAPKGYDIADYYLSEHIQTTTQAQPDATAEFPQMLDELPDVDAALAVSGVELLTADELPDVDVDLSTLPDFDLSTLPELPDVTAEFPQIPDELPELDMSTLPELPDAQFDDVEFVRSTILRVFGTTKELALETLHERLEKLYGSRNSSRLYHAAQAHKVLAYPQLDWKHHSRTGQSTYYVAVKKGATK